MMGQCIIRTCVDCRVWHVVGLRLRAGPDRDRSWAAQTWAAGVYGQGQIQAQCKVAQAESLETLLDLGQGGSWA